jgi:hypothetical protein
MSKKLPPKTARLETADATYYHFKTDIFKREITYSTDKTIAANLVTLDPERVFEIIEMNKKGEKPLSLLRDGNEPAKPKDAYTDLLDQDELTRFDSKRRKKKKKKGPRPAAAAADNQPQQQRAPKNGNQNNNE